MDYDQLQDIANLGPDPAAADMLTKLSGAAIDTFVALMRGPQFDGDLPSKSGRSELIELGLARRDRKFVGGQYDGCQMNELTDAGMKLAVHYHMPSRTSN